jgi:trehalose 6-phosphate phosphatase
VRTLMARPPMTGTLPVFVGDDETDEAAFIAARELGGAGILVGEREGTAALYGLADPTAVRAWLDSLAA